MGAIAVLSILAIGATSSVMQELKVAKFLTDSNTSFYPVLSTLETLKIDFAHDRTPGIMTLYDLRVRRFSLGDKTLEIQLRDEQAQINIDTAAKEALLKLPGLWGQETLVDLIVTAGLLVKEDLFSLEGMTEDIYKQFEEVVTVYGPGGVNLNTAGQDSLLLLGMDGPLMDKISAYRGGEDSQEATEDDRYFSSPQEIIPALEAYDLAPGERTLLETLVSGGRLITNSDYVRAGFSVTRGIKKIRFFEVVLKLSSGSIVSWQEH